MRRIASAAALILALAVPSFAPARGQVAATEALTVNLAAPTGPATGAGEGFLYGLNVDGTQPADQYLAPLGVTAHRGGGWYSGGWIKDGYRYGSATQADVASIISQARRLTQPPYHAQYQVLITDIYGLNGGQPSNTTYPCDNGDCSNWAAFIDAAVGALQASGLKLAYDIDNEPDISVFWTRGVNSAQYFQMWDTAYREIRRIAPGAQIVGPSFAYTPQARASQWQTWLAHVKAAGTVPDMITNHDEGDVDDPVAVSQALNSALTSAGVGRVPLSANEYQPADRQTAGVTAWYLARFAQSGYTNAMRGNWQCCISPNLTGVIDPNATGGAAYTGNWWALRTYADMTGTLVSTSGQVGSTAISAAEDSARRRAVAVVGDANGYTGAASVTFNGLSSVPWLADNGNVEAIVYRLPDQAALSAPQVVSDQIVSTSGGSITVPLTFQASHDAFAVYLLPGYAAGFTSTAVNLGDNLCMENPAFTTVAAAQLDQGACTSGADQQLQFIPTAAGADTYFIRTMTPDDCLDVSGSSSAEGTAVTQNPCTYAANEQFTLHATATGVYQVTAQNSGLCVAPKADGTTAGVGLVQVSCTTAASRTWKIQPGQTGGGFPSGYHRLTIGNDGLCLDVYGATGTAGAAIDQWTCNGQSNQQFQFVPVSGGYGELQAQNSGDDVAVSGSSTTAGQPDIVQQVPNGAANSLWLPVQQSDGSYEFRNQNSGLCLDVYGAGSNTGQQLDQWTCKNAPGTNQDFTPR
ncbi:RICIN domain-containing protein [Catenulispora subtropica]|uniref:RICIN domain-containing protein n=2 Tax=Catenulispora subtropica TaxID=450798 RepID=A0ABP5CSN7_9ACTN